ncbi:hypothetical protein [Bdellovibrio sp. HCB337]|uniref:hypothetical protein n=1 Tax=Bdellovibrio sp. HCB337 TaxID=3394358 RepID=UPI0039A4138A
MKPIIRNSFVAALLLSWSLQATAAELCKNVFYWDPFLKQAMTHDMTLMAAKSVESLRSSTTSARIENKWTLERPKIEGLIKSLSVQLNVKNIQVKARDAVTEGYRNVTHTVYLEKFELNLKESGMPVAEGFPSETVSFKTRIRKYGIIRNDAEVKTENVQFAEFTKDFSFVEFKFSDPRFIGAVFKPRVYMSDKYVQLFGTPEFIKRYDEIVAETLALKENAATKESATAMLEFLRLGHASNSSFAPLATNLYERISYAVDFVDRGRDNTKFQIQMTLDKSIAFFVNSMNKTVEAYRPEDSVVEIKTPVEYAGYNLESNLTKITGYRLFLQFVEKVKKYHQTDYMAGVGKMGHGHRQYLQDTEH